jgi:hypothetical protein
VASANAAVYIKAQEPGTAFEVITGSSDKSVDVTFGDYRTTGSGSQLGDLLAADFQVTSRSSGTHRLTISV